MPEIADGLVEISNVAREPGYRCKIAVISHADGVDPVGACVGPRGSRVRMVVSELRGERIDIIPYNDEAARFVAKALSPARVREVIVDDEEKTATIIVPDDQLSLAIGKEGQNARLASKLTGWRIDIKSQQQMAERRERASSSATEEDVDGQCMADRGQRQALPEPGAAGLSLLRHPRPPGARAKPRPESQADGGSPSGCGGVRPDARRTCVGCRRVRRRARRSCGSVRQGRVALAGRTGASGAAPSCAPQARRASEQAGIRGARSIARCARVFSSTDDRAQALHRRLRSSERR